MGASTSEPASNSQEAILPPQIHPTAIVDKRAEIADDVDRRALADLLGAVMTGLARASEAAGDPRRYTAAVEVLERYLEGALVRSDGDS